MFLSNVCFWMNLRWSKIFILMVQYKGCSLWRMENELHCCLWIIPNTFLILMLIWSTEMHSKCVMQSLVRRQDFPLLMQFSWVVCFASQGILSLFNFCKKHLGYWQFLRIATALALMNKLHHINGFSICLSTILNRWSSWASAALGLAKAPSARHPVCHANGPLPHLPPSLPPPHAGYVCPRTR